VIGLIQRNTGTSIRHLDTILSQLSAILSETRTETHKILRKPHDLRHIPFKTRTCLKGGKFKTSLLRQISYGNIGESGVGVFGECVPRSFCAECLLNERPSR
jgi:hypothetical protein